MFSLAPFWAYLMLALINTLSLLLTGKTNGAAILMIIYTEKAIIKTS